VLRRSILPCQVDEDVIEPPLLQLARHLESGSYAAAPVELKAASLAALCDRALDALGRELSTHAEELEAALKARAVRIECASAAAAAAASMSLRWQLHVD
jgi:hypothetical protein